MGFVKNEWMESIERGWNDIDDKHVCEDCVDDEFLKEQVRSELVARKCDYCDTEDSEAIAAPVHTVVTPIGQTVDYYFSDPAEAGVPRDEGEWLVEPIDTEEVLLGLCLNCHDELFADIVNAFTNDGWVPAVQGSWSSLRVNEMLTYSWNSFCEWVKHETRFFFSEIPSQIDEFDRDQIEYKDVLPMVGQLVNDLNLIYALPKDTKLYRARKRTRGDDWTPSAETMGAPPSLQATAGRMNPAGISYFYLAFDEPTAVTEVIGTTRSEVAVAQFQSARELTILDLTALPAKPSIFDPERREEREGLIFLDDFVKAISQPVAKDVYEHISYVPSQVVSEYFALVFRNGDNTAIEGIAFPSAVCPEGKNLVLFPTERGIRRAFDQVAFMPGEISE